MWSFQESNEHPEVIFWEARDPISVIRGFMENAVVSLEKYRHSLLNQGPKSLKTKVYGASTYIQTAAIL